MPNRATTIDLSGATAESAPILLADIAMPAPVWGYDGERLGFGRAVALDQGSGRPLCLLVGRGRSKRSLRPVPWAALRYDGRLSAYLADVSAPVFLQGPGWSRAAGRALASIWRAYVYYDVPYDSPAK